MKYKLINQPNENYSAKKQILINRGFEPKEIEHYFNLSDADINEPEVFGEELLKSAATALRETIDANEDICIVVDADCDGYTSSAVLINYLHDLAPAFTESHVHYYLHEGKQHGLSDCITWIEDIGPSLVIIPDAGSNDTEHMQKLYENDIKIIILDHHEIEGEPFPRCFLINSQSPEYPNKELSGAGVVYQFCRYLDKINNVKFADWYLDLVALGLDGDMMSLKSCETRWLIFKGLEPNNIHNPFIYEMWQKNKFKLGDAPTAWGITFYIVPFVNAITRSGTLEEKELIFSSMLKFKAFKEISSNKRGHKQGEMEQLVTQAVRTCTNVKNRQTRAEEAGIELVEHLIKDNNMMEHKVLLFQLEPGQIKPEIRGLIANKLMAKYQRPCCMLTKTIKRKNVLINGCIGADGDLYYPTKVGEVYAGTGCAPKIVGVAWGSGIEEYITYEGSARGCDKVGVTEFKDICAATQVCEYTVGHQGAFGLGLRKENISAFIESTDKQLANMPNEPIYYVDYIWDYKDVNGEAILEIANMDKYWGKDVDEPVVAVQGIQVTKDMLTMMASNTCKITLPNRIAMIKFRMPDEDYNKLYSENGYVEINAVCRCNANEWGGNISPQLLIDDFEIVGGCAYVF